jgi:hypothetical protein
MKAFLFVAFGFIAAHHCCEVFYKKNILEFPIL